MDSNIENIIIDHSEKDNGLYESLYIIIIESNQRYILSDSTSVSNTVLNVNSSDVKKGRQRHQI